jgi:hypothetical protein
MTVPPPSGSVRLRLLLGVLALLVGVVALLVAILLVKGAL